MEVKVEVNKEFDEYDQRYVATQLSTELDRIELKDESDKYSLETGNKNYSDEEHGIKIVKTLSSKEEESISRHSEEKAVNGNVKIQTIQGSCRCKPSDFKTHVEPYCFEGYFYQTRAIPVPAEEIQAKDHITDLDKSKIVPNHADFTPVTPSPVLLETKYEICAPLLRYPLTLNKLHNVSTFIPTSFNYFQVVHFMDKLMSTNIDFLRMGLPWHPLLSRLYFAELFFIQTLRAMRHARIGSSSTRQFIEQFLKDYPPESIPVPGPLIPILQSISTCRSENHMYGLISPSIRNDVGYACAADLLDINSKDFILPNIPIIAAFLNTIITAPGTAPDYSDPATFDDTQEHTLVGHRFEARNWQILERLVLLSPGLNHTMESTPDIDEEMRFRGQELGIPFIEHGTNVMGFERYMLMDEDSSWFQNVIEVMSIYCGFFKESATLGACSPHGPICGLLRSRLHDLTSQNIVNNLDRAFPGEYPFQLMYEHRSYEENFPQTYSLMGQLSSINTSTNYPGLEYWGDFNNSRTGRSGPYWNQNPSVSRSAKEDYIQEVENLIRTHYFKEQP
ncbi:uncharacterized protein LOC126886904 [Diabrotica virgifera virgifera]|uniref:Uncharacterized protein n=1 Tax=Diabrotica virgifera virgifera TaxID=50390 RepID=A0ABM5KIH1_DIAVI|nr:uncharacterized protein LOC126886904 [Diabrotica virgifera virgifera]